MPDTGANIEDRERRLDQAAAHYLKCKAAGKTIDRQWFFHEYSDLKEELGEFLDDLEHFEQAAAPIRDDQTVSRNGQSFAPGITNGPVTTDTTVRHALDPPATSNRYRLKRFLARGGMGEVWSAEDVHIGRQIAVKRVLTRARAGTVAEERFLLESQIMGQLEHPNIVPLHDLGRDERGVLYAVMKLVDGSSLKERLVSFHATKSGVDWSRQIEFVRLLQAFASICRAVAYAHSRGVLHRDIKPDNIMLGNYGEALLLDWGLAKILDDVKVNVATETQSPKVHLAGESGPATMTGTIMGSPAYMPPEIAEGHADVADERADVYLLGATLYELLTGIPPRQGSSQCEIIALAKTSTPTPPRQIDSRLPKNLEAVCLKAMARESDQRYDSALALAIEIENYLANEPVAAYRESAPLRFLRFCRRHRQSLARTLTACVFVVVGGLMWLSYHRAAELEARETARIQFIEFRRLANETQFFAANTDTVNQRAPYFDPQRAIEFGTAALASAAPWGDQALRFPIDDQRPALTSELYDLLLVLANLRQQSARTADQQREVLALLDRAERLQPASRAFYQIRSRCQRQMGRTDDADHDLQIAADVSSLTAQDWFLAGEMERSASSQRHDTAAVQRAIDDYQQALRLDPEHYWAQFQLARCYVRTQRGPEAVALLGTCVALRPDAPWAYSTRGLVHGLLGQFDDAHADLLHAQRLAPQFRTAQLNRGFVYFLQNDDAAAFTELDAVLAPPAESVLIEAAFYRAQIHYQRGDLADALGDCDSFLAERPDFAPAHTLRAQIQFRLGQDAEAIQSVNAAIESGQPSAMQPQDSEPALVRGTALRELATGLDLVTQRRVLRLAMQEFSSVGSRDINAEMTSIKDLLGLSDAVVEAYSERLAAVPTDIETRKKRGWNYVSLRQFDLARTDFQTTLLQTITDAEAHTGLGYVMARQGEPDHAEQEAAKALLYGADDSLVLHNVACIYAELAESNPRQQKHYEDFAITMLERAVSLAKQNSTGFSQIELIRNEPAFHEGLRNRTEFQRLLGNP